MTAIIRLCAGPAIEPWLPLLNLQAPLQSEAVSRLLGKKHFSLVAGSPLSQTLHESAYLVLAFDLGAETPYGCSQAQMRLVGIDRNKFELQIGLAGQRSSGFGGDDLTGNPCACGDNGLPSDYDVLIQRSRKALVRLADPGAKRFA